MSVKCGIIGLPNVGKSTLFNALLGLEKANVSNYPFCTISPNKAIIPLEDERLQKLSVLSCSKKITYTGLQCIDIAGLIKGAAQGEGLGNQFLANIREADAIIHVCRCFSDKNIHHVDNRIDPVHDLNVVETELRLSDLQTLEKILQKSRKTNDQDKHVNKDLVRKIMKYLDSSQPLVLSNEELEQVKSWHLLSIKPEIYVCNTDEASITQDNDFVTAVRKYANSRNKICLKLCAKLENEIAILQDIEERQAFLQSMSIEKSGLQQIASTMYRLLELITFFTTGVQETRAWAIKNQSTASEAAGTIHTDFQKKFIKAEVVSYENFLQSKNFPQARILGMAKFEGRDYVVRDGDVIYFHHNA